MTSRGGCVALTGGTGFLGPYIAAALERVGWRVRRLVRGGFRPGMAHEDVVAGSLDDEAALARLLDGADVLVHAAGLIKAPTREAFMRVNRDGSRRLAEAVARLGRPVRVVMVSSLAAREPGLSDYAASKRAGEDAFRAAALPHLTVLRPTAVYGPGDKETAVFMRACAGPVLPIPRVPDGRITLIHAEDVAAAVAACADGNEAGGTFELTDERVGGYGWRELARSIRSAADSRAAIVELPKAVFQGLAACNALAARASGRAAMLTPGKVREMFHPDWSSAPDRQPPSVVWRPRVGLDDGLAQTVLWLRSGHASPTQGWLHHAN